MNRFLLLLLIGVLCGGLAAAAQSKKPSSRSSKAPRVRTIKLDDPILVFYRELPPGTAAQQLVMDAKSLPLLKRLTLEELINRPDVFFDGVDSREFPGTAKNRDKLRLVGSYGLITAKRLPAGDGRSQYVKLHKPKQGVFYVFYDDASPYRTLVSDGRGGSRVDFQANVLPGVDSVRAVYVLRIIEPTQRGASIR